MQDNNSNNGRRNNGGLVIGLVIAAIFLLTFAPSLVPLLIVGGIIFTVVRNARNAQNGTTGNNTPYNPNGAPYPGTGAGAPPTTTYTYTGSYQPQQGQQPNGMPPPAIQAAPQPIVVTHTAAAPVSLVSPHGAPPAPPVAIQAAPQPIVVPLTPAMPVAPAMPHAPAMPSAPMAAAPVTTMPTTPPPAMAGQAAPQAPERAQAAWQPSAPPVANQPRRQTTDVALVGERATQHATLQDEKAFWNKPKDDFWSMGKDPWEAPKEKDPWD